MTEEQLSNLPNLVDRAVPGEVKDLIARWKYQGEGTERKSNGLVIPRSIGVGYINGDPRHWAAVVVTRWKWDWVRTRLVYWVKMSGLYFFEQSITVGG